jgi:hypothetical protein
MRSEQTLHSDRKFNGGTGVGWQELLTDSDVEHPPENSELLVDGRRLDCSQLSVAELRLDANMLAETLSKIQLNAVSSDLDQAAFSKRSP